MPVYVWKGKNSYGDKRKGEIEAPDQASALAQVKRLRISDPVVKEKPKDLFENIEIFKPKVTGKDIVIFTRQLSTMIDAGLPLVQGLEILEKQQSNPTFKSHWVKFDLMWNPVLLFPTQCVNTLRFSMISLII